MVRVKLMHYFFFFKGLDDSRHVKILRKTTNFLAELLRAKRASGAPWVRIFGKPMRPRKFGAYARPPARAYRLSGRGVES